MMTAFKITPKKFQGLIYKETSTNIFGSSAEDSAATDEDLPYRRILQGTNTLPIYQIEVRQYKQFPYAHDQFFIDQFKPKNDTDMNKTELLFDGLTYYR